MCFFWPQGTWLLASWVGMEPTLLGRQILNHWRIREVLRRGFLSEEEEEKRRRQKRVSGTGSREGRIRAAISRPETFPWQVFDAHPKCHPLHQSWLSWTQTAPDLRPNFFLLQPSPTQPRPSVTRPTSPCSLWLSRGPIQGSWTHTAWWLGSPELHPSPLAWRGGLAQAWSLLCFVSDFNLINQLKPFS